MSQKISLYKLVLLVIKRALGYSRSSNLFGWFEYWRDILYIIVWLVRSVWFKAVVQFNKFIVLDAEFLPEVSMSYGVKAI